MALLAATAAMAVVPPVTQAVVEVRREGRPFVLTLLESIPTAASLKGFEDSLVERAELGRAVRRRVAFVLDRLARRGNRKVVMGRRGWLFQREGVELVRGRDFHEHWRSRGAPPPEEAILDFHRQLEARGIALLLVPVPTKETLHPERLWPRADPRSRPSNPGMAAFRRTLSDRGVEVLDVEDLLAGLKAEGRETYLRRDTHWTPEAMQAVASAIAAAIDPRLGGGPRRAFDHRLVDFEGRGDLARMLAYGDAPWGHAAMPLLVTQVIADRQGRGPTGTGAAAVLLLGDSFTNVFANGDPDMGAHGGLGEHLASALRRPVDVIAMPAGGATRARRALAIRPEALAGKRVVVWQFAERDLRFADEWRSIEIPEARPEEKAATPRRRVEARVLRVSDVPPNMTYRRCLVVVSWADVATGETMFVIHQGWIDGVPQPVLALRPGDVRSLVVEPFAGHVDLESSCWIETIGMDRSPLWALPDDAS